jgi:transposase
MITQKVAYKPPTDYVFLDQKRKEKLVERIKKNITKFDMKAKDFDFATH